MKQISFIVIEAATGAIRWSGSCPEVFLAHQTGGDDSLRAVALTDADIMVHHDMVDLSKLPVDGWPCCLAGIVIDTSASEQTALENACLEALSKIDRWFADEIAGELGPVAGMHVRKRAQAEAGGGPLVVDEDDRLAILARSAEQDQRLAEIETRRRALKAMVRAAASAEDLQGALQQVRIIK